MPQQVVVALVDGTAIECLDARLSFAEFVFLTVDSARRDLSDNAWQPLATSIPGGLEVSFSESGTLQAFTRGPTIDDRFAFINAFERDGRVVVLFAVPEGWDRTLRIRWDALGIPETGVSLDR